MERKLLLVVLAVVGFSGLLWSAEGAIGCRDEKGNNVDWWVILKSPKLEKHQDASAASGFGYSYGDSRNGQVRWTGKRLDTNKNGALGATLGQIYSAPQRTAYVIYSDQPPVGDDASSGYAHAKGAVAWDGDRGFWLIHSVPNFPPKATSNYGLPDNAVVNGQSFMCLTFSKSAMDQVGAALLIDRPFIFSKNLPNSLRSFSSNLAKVFDGEYTSEATASSFSVKTAGGDPFVIFAKNKAWGSDLYSKLVAPTLKSSLLVETWMNGATSNKLPSFCAGSKYPYSVMNVKEVTLAPTISWGNTEDHSKWAVSTTSKPGAFCIGDINRQASQAGRGGGTVCGSDNAVWNSFKSFVTESKTCKGYNGN